MPEQPPAGQPVVSDYYLQHGVSAEFANRAPIHYARFASQVSLIMTWDEFLLCSQDATWAAFKHSIAGTPNAAGITAGPTPLFYFMWLDRARFMAKGLKAFKDGITAGVMNWRATGRPGGAIWASDFIAFVQTAPRRRWDDFKTFTLQWVCATPWFARELVDFRSSNYADEIEENGRIDDEITRDSPALTPNHQVMTDQGFMPVGRVTNINMGWARDLTPGNPVTQNSLPGAAEGPTQDELELARTVIGRIVEQHWLGLSRITSLGQTLKVIKGKLAQSNVPEDEEI